MASVSRQRAALVAISPLLLFACADVLGIDDATRAAPAGEPAAESGDSPPTESATTPHACADIKSDPQHCGRCGHDCLGGACVDGVCGPAKVVAAPGAIELRVTDTHLAWKTAHGIIVCELPSCRTRRFIAGTFNVAHDFDLMGDTVIAARQAPFNAATSPPADAAMPDKARLATIEAVALGGAQPKLVTTRDWQRGYTSVREVGGRLFIDDALGVTSCALPRCSDERTEIAGEGFTTLGVDEHGTWVLETSQVRAVRVCRDGACAEPVLTLDGSLSFAGYSRGVLTWSTGGKISACRATDCAATTRELFTVDHFAAIPVTDGRDVYAANRTSVVRCAADGCSGSPEVVYRGGVAGLVVPTANAVFVYDGAAPAIFRIVR